MNNLSCIYWFSGTGNSLYAAKKLAAALRNLPLVQITNELPSCTIGGEAQKIGFVFPSYYGNLPRAVRAFIEKLEIKPGTYLFAVVTMGAVGQGSVGALQSVLKERGIRLDYGRGLTMPANYVLKYNPADSSTSITKRDKVDKSLQSFADDIAIRKHLIKKLPITANNLYKDIASLDTSFHVTDSCTSCGLCQRICPVKNIKLENGKPMWLHHCEHCVACISWCPEKAIEYANLTQNRRRYHNESIKADELARKKEQTE